MHNDRWLPLSRLEQRASEYGPSPMARLNLKSPPKPVRPLAQYQIPRLHSARLAHDPTQEALEGDFRPGATFAQRRRLGT